MLNQYPAHLDEKVKESANMFSMEAQENSSLNIMFKVENSDDYSKGYTSIEGGTGVDYFGEAADLSDVDNLEGWKAVGVSAEFGGKITITKKETLNAKDETTLFNKIVDTKVPVLISDAYNFAEVNAMKMLNLGFTTALAPDAVAIFGTHSYKSTGREFINRSPGDTAAGEAALTELEQYCGAFTDANGKPMPMRMKTLIAKQGGTAAKNFRKVLAGDTKMQSATIGNVNVYNNGDYTLIESPFITSDTNWFAKDSTKESALIVEYIQGIILEDRQTRENLTQVFPASASFRFGAFELPTMWYGSNA
jgi:hypothetical protein